MVSENLQLPNGWKKTIIGKVAKFGSGAKKPSDVSDSNDDGKYPVYGGNGIIGYSPEFNSKGPEIIIGRVGEKCGCIHVSESACWVTDNALRIKERYTCIYHTFFAEALKKARIENFRAKGGQPLITQTGISGIPIILPPLPEQKAIADLLSTWDEAIEKTERLIQAKEQRFRWLLRKLMSPVAVSSSSNDECLVMNDETGSNSDLSTNHSALQNSASKPRNTQNDVKWKRMKLDEIGEIKKGKGITKSDLTQKGVPCIRYAEIYTSYQFFTSKLQSNVTPIAFNSAAEITKGDILFAASGETKEEIGKSIAYLGNKRACTGGDTLILRPSKVVSNSRYLGFALNLPEVNKQKSAYAQGNSVVHLYGKDLAKIEILLPPIEIQRQISKALALAQGEIDLLKKLAEKYKTQKRGLMQKMLTGKWRVKPDIVKAFEE